MSARSEMPPLTRYGTARLRAAPSSGAARERGASLFHRLGAAARAYDLGDDMLFLAEELALADGAGDPEATGLLVLCALAAARQGSTRLPLEAASAFIAPIAEAAELSRPVSELADAVRARARAGAEAEAGLIGGPDTYRPLILDRDGVYLQRHHARQRRLWGAIRGRSAGAAGGDALRAAIEDIRARPASPGGAAIALSDEQLAAIEAAALQPFTAIAGGPGTGKTAIIVALLRALVRTGTPPSRIALCAPTGKAAKRMADSIGAGLAHLADPAPPDRELAGAPPEPRTLHRLLGYQPAADRYRHHENNPIPADIVIADEASMIDLELAERLVRAAAPEAQIVLFGDADQLPSVDAGAVFRDLVAAGEATGTSRRLTRSYRMDPSDPAGRAILLAARAVGRGEAGALLEPGAEARAPLCDEPRELAFEGVEILDTRGEQARLGGFLADWHRRFVAPDAREAELVGAVYRARGGLLDDRDTDPVREIFSRDAGRRLLAVTRQLATGSDAINAAFHDRALEATGLSGRPEFVPGEPILMRRNDYRRQLFNGDQGIVLRVASGDEPQRFCAVFPTRDGYAAYPIDAIRTDIELAYALTVHKAQGSEHDAVALVLPHAEQPLLTRELVYTALTRARRAAVIAGPRRLVARASRSATRYT